MKSLSDYQEILRDIATNLNLHGESVEMVVQMLANSLYISEVEHIAYSQEASLERASQENSKIQHCVNQMYSVYRGANPRVILNLRTSKLFSFKPHQEIIKSNNYTVYYLGYFNEEKKIIEYSDHTVYPETNVTIIGILSKEVITKSWTSNSTNNPYYYTLPESDLSGDLYLDISGIRKDVTRIFSDHLMKDISFDLTIPGYGLRLYYPESLQGESGYGTSYSLSVYRYMSLSEILDSEKKAIKMIGSQIVGFDNWVLRELKASETYPGVIFIPETPRDAIDTIHHKANRARYSGSYLTTNSDLSWILQEYFPSKIRRNGVTYKFDTPESTRIKVTTNIFKPESISFSAKQLSGIDSVYIPSGTLRFRYKLKEDDKIREGEKSSYEILPSISVIPVKVSYISDSVINYIQPTISNISFRVLKITGGNLEILTSLTDDDLELTYNFPDGESGEGLEINNISLGHLTNEPLEVTLRDKNGKILDKENIPFIYTPVTIGKVETKDEDGEINESYFTVTEEGPGEYYNLDVQEDTLYVRTDLYGNIIETSGTTASLFYNGKEISGVSYSLIPSSDLEATIDSGTGVISITKMSDKVDEANLLVKARYGGMNFQSLVVCKKIISNLDSVSTSEELPFSLYSDLSDKYPVKTLSATSEIKEASLEIPGGVYKKLYVEEEDKVVFSDIEYIYGIETLENLLPTGTQMTPSLELYYIPYSESNTLNDSEKSDFIEGHKTYYITQNISIKEGTAVVARFDISLDLYKNTSLDNTILDILQSYSYLFDQDFGDGDSEICSDIKALITKISEVKNVRDLKVSYLNPTTREEMKYEDIKKSGVPEYYIIECVISSIIKE